jgi:hypothetical protein
MTTHTQPIQANVHDKLCLWGIDLNQPSSPHDSIAIATTPTTNLRNLLTANFCKSAMAPWQYICRIEHRGFSRIASGGKFARQRF